MARTDRRGNGSQGHGRASLRGGQDKHQDDWFLSPFVKIRIRRRQRFIVVDQYHRFGRLFR